MKDTAKEIAKLVAFFFLVCLVSIMTALAMRGLFDLLQIA